MRIFLRAACAFSIIFTAAFAQTAIADTTTADAANAAGDSSLDEVVITAELRDRALRDLPASATVLDAHTLEVAGVQHFQDVLGQCQLLPVALLAHCGKGSVDV